MQDGINQSQKYYKVTLSESNSHRLYAYLYLYKYWQPVIKVAFTGSQAVYFTGKERRLFIFIDIKGAYPMITETGYIRIPVRETAIVSRRRAHRHYIDKKKGYYITKRIFDILVSLLAITGLLSWLLPVLAIMIKLDSKGPVFFLQKRVGRGGRSFSCFKFRTMIVNSEANTLQAVTHDPRITRLGKLLRKTNIDELPQFFNVLLGTMSVVGPRPHMHADCRLFASKVSAYKLRNLVKPGITGLSQVKGYHGTVISDECIVQRYHWDIHYIQHAGLGMDVRIILKTAVRFINFL